jgi:hypothetical protein
MDAATAALLLQVLGAYAALGAAFAPAFLSLGAARIDPATRGAGACFRLAILPGVLLFWPWLGCLWLRASRHPA